MIAGRREQEKNHTERLSLYNWASIHCVPERRELCVAVDSHSRLRRWKTWFYRSLTLLLACSIFPLLFKHTLRHIAALVQLSIRVTQISANKQPKAALRLQPSLLIHIYRQSAQNPTRPTARKNFSAVTPALHPHEGMKINNSHWFKPSESVGKGLGALTLIFLYIWRCCAKNSFIFTCSKQVFWHILCYIACHQAGGRK